MSLNQQGIIIVGAGAAGLSAAVTVRAEGYDGPLGVVNGEQHRPYNRTLVNKALLSGLITPEQITQPAAHALEVDLMHGVVVSADTSRRTVTLSGGRQLTYGALLAASGSAPRLSPLVPAASERVLQLHTIDDAVRLRDQLGDEADKRTITVVGAGFVGAETASFLADRGARVHLASRPTVPMSSTLGLQIAQRVAEFHHAHVDTHFGQDVLSVEEGSASVVTTLSGGHVLESDLVVVALGTVPDSAWLTGDTGGIAVDPHLRAVQHPHVYAAGSIAFHSTDSGHQYRIDHWDDAITQGTHAAKALLHDLDGAPDPGPYKPVTGFTLSLYQQVIAAYGRYSPALGSATTRWTRRRHCSPVST
ncbi:FAD-dependent oxidoreductase [Arthrobacter sp. H5]|uniref:FAD-dependent oxidoreductase n=1 Tax=Arthrobacter sp. H5 TaxID=1267973 RepID=UPI000480E6F5|nr:FAD-dependent oxidoreductase [Arthrobacter sp. H5]